MLSWRHTSRNWKKKSLLEGFADILDLTILYWYNDNILAKPSFHDPTIIQCCMMTLTLYYPIVLAVIFYVRLLSWIGWSLHVVSSNLDQPLSVYWMVQSSVSHVSWPCTKISYFIANKNTWPALCMILHTLRNRLFLCMIVIYVFPVWFGIILLSYDTWAIVFLLKSIVIKRFGEKTFGDSNNNRQSFDC